MTSLVTVEHHQGYAVVGLNRPEKRNALNRAARRELLTALTLLRAECRSIVLTGCGDSFCSGVDLRKHARMPRQGQRQIPDQTGLKC